MPALHAAIATDPRRYRVLTGERPTGPLHLGHLVGSIVERVRLQRAGAQVVVILADYQVITDRETADRVREHVRGAVLDQLAAGLDPDTTTIFTHSAVPALNQLMLPFLSLVTEAELHRNPTVRAELEASGRALSGLLLTYPVHQAADILFCKADLVPVGKDNLPHVEITRTIARRFAERYGPVFPIPEPMVTDNPQIPGLDGRTAALCSGTTPDELADVIGDGGSSRLKEVTTAAVNTYLASRRARRAELARAPGLVDDVLRRGNHRANEIAEATLDEVRSAMGMDYRMPRTAAAGGR